MLIKPNAAVLAEAFLTAMGPLHPFQEKPAQNHKDCTVRTAKFLWRRRLLAARYWDQLLLNVDLIEMDLKEMQNPMVGCLIIHHDQGQWRKKISSFTHRQVCQNFKADITPRHQPACSGVSSLLTCRAGRAD